MCISLLLIFVSCKDETSTFRTPETERYFHGYIDTQEKSMVDGQNAYRNSHTDSCYTIGVNLTWSGSGKLYQANSEYFMSNKESFGFYIHNLIDESDDRDAMLMAYFNNSLSFAYVDFETGDLLSTSGAEIRWRDSKGEMYSTLYIVQSGGIGVDKFIMNMEEGRTILLELSINCTLHNPVLKKTLSLTNGKARISIRSDCF
jgi:hypothetical protein